MTLGDRFVSAFVSSFAKCRSTYSDSEWQVCWRSQTHEWEQFMGLHKTPRKAVLQLVASELGNNILDWTDMLEWLPT